MLKHFVNIQYGCGMQSMRVCSLNHDTATSYRLGPYLIFLKCTPTCTCNTAMDAHPQHLKVLNRECLREGDSETSRDKLMRSKGNSSEHKQGTLRENLHHIMVKTVEDLSWDTIVKSLFIVFSWIRNYIVYMNTLKVGYTSKAHHFTSQIVSQM